MKFKINLCFLFLSLFSIGCTPDIPGVNIPPTPMTWKVALAGSAHVLDKNFDFSGNAYLLDTYFDNNLRQIVYRLVKIEPAGTTAWNISGFLDIDTTTFWWENIRSAELVFDTAGDIYINGIIYGQVDTNTRYDHAVLNAKILSDGTIAWQTKQIIAATTGQSIPRIGLSPIISRNNTLFVATYSEDLVHVHSFNTQGAASQVYTSNNESSPAFQLQQVDQKNRVINDNKAMGHAYGLHTKNTIYKSTKEQAISPQFGDHSIDHKISSFAIGSDDTITMVYPSSIKKYELSGALVWEKPMALEAPATCTVDHSSQQVQAVPDGSVMVLLKYFCASGEAEKYPFYPKRGGYTIVQNNSLGQEVLRIERDLPIHLSQSLLVDYISGFADVSFQVDNLGNLLVSEQYISGQLWFLLEVYLISDALNITTLTRKYDTSGTLVKQVRTAAIRRIALDRQGDLRYENFGDSEPFHVDGTGSLSLFIRTDPGKVTDSVLPVYKYIVANHHSVF